MATPKWLARARQDLGLAEVPGGVHNPKIIGYWRAIGRTDIDDDETAWCAVWASAMLEASGIPSPKSAAARDFLKWGDELHEPMPGALLVFRRGLDPKAGHVGFYVGDSGGNYLVLGGNQGNRVSIAPVPKLDLIGIRWPSEEPLRPSAGAAAAVRARAAAAQTAPAGPERTRIEDAKQSWTVTWSLVGLLGTVVQFFAERIGDALAWVGVVSELGPLKAALLGLGANTGAVGFGVGVAAAVLLVQRRLFKDAK